MLTIFGLGFLGSATAETEGLVLAVRGNKVAVPLRGWSYVATGAFFTVRTVVEVTVIVSVVVMEDSSSACGGQFEV